MRKSGRKECGFEGCSRAVKAKGYCNGHYQQFRVGKVLCPLQVKYDQAGNVKGEDSCSFPDCPHDALCHGLCDGHYQQKRAGQELQPLQVIRKGQPCSVEGCTRLHAAKGYCHSHYDKWRLYGDPLAPSRRDPSRVEEVDGCLHVHLEGKHGEGKKTLVSCEDLSYIEGRRFWANKEGYVQCKIEGKRISLHRLLLELEATDSREVDHINGDPLDNRRENLRVVTKAQQNQNRKVRSDSETGHRNVHFDSKKDLYRVIVTKDRKRYGHRHKKLEDAVAEAQRLRDELFTHHNEDRV